MVSSLHVISFLLFGGVHGLRVPDLRLASQPQEEYTGYDAKNGWEYPKTNWNPPWTESLVEDKWMKAHQRDVDKLTARAAHKGDCRVVLLGDSIIELFVRGSFNSGQKDPDRIVIRDDVRIFALGGDRFRDQGWRLFQGGGIEALQACQPEQVFMMLGTNDYQNVPGENQTIQDLHNLISQLREKLPEETELIVHSMLPRSCGDADAERCAKTQADFVSWTERINQQLQAAVKKANDSQGQATYADCADDVPRDDSHYLDAIHLKTEGLTVFGQCLQSRYGMEMMADKPKEVDFHQSIAMRQVRSGLLQTDRTNKLVVLVGDSVDRYTVDSFCEANVHKHAKLYFAQAPTTQFGAWSKMGKIDERLAQKLEESGNPAWKSWMVHVCHVPTINATVASVFNVRGVSLKMPFWHQDIMENQFDMKFRNEGTVEFLGPPLHAIEQLYSEPSWQHTTVINSNFWDADREYYLRAANWQNVAKDYLSSDWKPHAANLIDGVKEIVPSSSKLYWRTSNLPKANTATFLGYGIELSKGEFGNRDVVKLINKAAREVAQEKDLEILDWENIASKPTDYIDGTHPVGDITVPEIEKLLSS